VFENYMLRRIFELRKKEVDSRMEIIFCNEEHHNLYFLPNYYGDQNKEDELGRPCSSHLVEEKYI
jgi:hypothetical protein